MKELLKIYIKDFVLNSLFLYGLVWPVSYSIYLISSATLSLYTITIIIFSMFFLVLFLSSYPLRDITKWALYTPIPKRDLILFNIIFQTFKSIMMVFYFFLTYLICIAIEKEKLIFKLSQKQDVDYTGLLGEKSVDFSGTLFIALGIYIAVNIIYVIYNVSLPHTIKGDTDYKKKRLEKLKYYAHKYRKYLILIIPLLFLFHYFKGHLSSALFIASFFTALMVVILIKQYRDNLVFSDPGGKKYFICFIFMMSGLFFSYWGYSHYQISQEHFTATQKVKEITFQGSFYFPLDKKSTVSLLESSLNSTGIENLVEIYSHNNNLHFKREDLGIFENAPTFSHELSGLSLSRLIINKKSYRSLLFTLGLFDPTQIPMKEIHFFLEKWEQMEKSDKFFRKDLLRKISLRDFNKKEIQSLIRASDTIKQFIGLHLAAKSPKYHLANTIKNAIPRFNSEILLLAGKTVSQINCQNISSLDLVNHYKNKVYYPTNPTCRQKRIRSLSSQKNQK